MSESGQEIEKVNGEPAVVVKQFPEGLVQKLQGVIVYPAAFFEAMPAPGSYVAPAVFLAITSVVHAIPSAIIQGHPFSVFFDFIGGFSFFVFMAGVLFGLSKMFGGEGSFRATFAVSAYASAPKLVTWIPWVGSIFGLYSLYLLVLGLRTVQKISTKKAIVVVAIPTIALLIFSVVLSIVARMIPHGH